MYYFIHYKNIYRYLKIGDLKIIVHVIKHANFLFYLAYFDITIWETDNSQQIYKQKNSTFYSSSEACLKNNVLRRKNIISCIQFNDKK